MKRISILQSNYIPWKGYFDIIGKSDIVVFYDDVQFTKNDWRNRNIIKSPNGLSWLSIPCGSNIRRLICDVIINDLDWQKSHFDKIFWCYKSAPYFKYFKDFISEIYLNNQWTHLSEINQYIIKLISKEIFGFKTIFDDSRKYNLTLKGSGRVIELLKQLNATHYLSGPSGSNYLVESNFLNNNINLEYIDYSNYKEYPQLYPPFVHNVSVIDLIFNVGYDSKYYL
jgi:hypothetical protein